MHKALLAALIGASVFAVLPALAQFDRGDEAKAGAGVAAGAHADSHDHGADAPADLPANVSVGAGAAADRARGPGRAVDEAAAHGH